MPKSEIAYKRAFVKSVDGTEIGYRQMGNGPGIILLHGGANASQHFMELGKHLSDEFTIYIPDRRGRGLSGPFGQDYSMEREIEDINSIITKTGAYNIFGLSSGALIALEAAHELPIKKAALYEPPLDTDNSIINILSFMKRFDKEISEGNVAAATATLLKDFGIHFGLPAWITGIPHFILEGLFRIYFKTEKVKGDDVPVKILIPTFHYDYILVEEEKGRVKKFKDINAEVLLIGGSLSPEFLKKSMDELSKNIAHVKCVELEGLAHSGPLESGDPKRVAKELKKFFY
jgi:pimeloyl-ACP methyl ester carboxylesterase